MFKFISSLNGRTRLIFDLGVIFLISVLVMIPILIGGIPDSQDIPQQYQFAQNYYNAILNGEYYPSWASSPNYGYGDVSVRFYPPLTYFILAFFRFLSGNWYDASLLFFTAIYFLSGLGIYLWARERFSANSALFGAFVYIVLPYHVMQVYIGAVFSEFTAVALLPFCLMFIDRVCRHGRLIDIAGLAFFYGLLTFTHLPTILTSSLAFGVFALFSFRKGDLLRSGAKLSAGATFGLMLSSFYWVRMIPEMAYLKHNGEAYISGVYSYKTKFIFSYLFPFIDVNFASPLALMNVIAILTVGVLVSFYVLYFTRSRATAAPSIKNVFALSLFSLFMAMPLSMWLWELIPILQKIQFPFRWLTLVSVGTAFVAAAGFGAAVEYFRTPKRYLATLAFGLFLICFPYTYFRMMTPILTYPRDYLNRIAEGFRTMPSYECWWTVWTPVDKEAVSGLPRPKLLTAKVVLNDRNHELGIWSATEKSFTLEAGEAGQAQVATLYYPHWKAFVNGQSVETSPTETGLISLAIPAEQSEVRIQFREPRRVVAFYYVAGLAWMILGIFLIGNLYKTRQRPTGPQENV
jgi:hypothetical protein